MQGCISVSSLPASMRELLTQPQGREGIARLPSQASLASMDDDTWKAYLRGLVEAIGAQGRSYMVRNNATGIIYSTVGDLLQGEATQECPLADVTLEQIAAVVCCVPIITLNDCLKKIEEQENQDRLELLVTIEKALAEYMVILATKEAALIGTLTSDSLYHILIDEIE